MYVCMYIYIYIYIYTHTFAIFKERFVQMEADGGVVAADTFVKQLFATGVVIRDRKLSYVILYFEPAYSQPA